MSGGYFLQGWGRVSSTWLVVIVGILLGLGYEVRGTDMYRPAPLIWVGKGGLYQRLWIMDYGVWISVFLGTVGNLIEVSVSSISGMCLLLGESYLMIMTFVLTVKEDSTKSRKRCGW